MTSVYQLNSSQRVLYALLNNNKQKDKGGVWACAVRRRDVNSREFSLIPCRPRRGSIQLCHVRGRCAISLYCHPSTCMPDHHSTLPYKASLLLKSHKRDRKYTFYQVYRSRSTRRPMAETLEGDRLLSTKKVGLHKMVLVHFLTTADRPNGFVL